MFTLSINWLLDLTIILLLLIGLMLAAEPFWLMPLTGVVMICLPAGGRPVAAATGEVD